MVFVSKGGGRIFEHTHHGEPIQVHYASLTARSIVRCEIRIDGELVDVVFAGGGGSHSWWLNNGVGLLPKPLQDGQKITVDVDNEAAFRIDL